MTAAPALEVKICGITTLPVLERAVSSGAAYIGLVFFAKSPRNLSLDAAADLARATRNRAQSVALVVDAPDALLSEIAAAVAPDWFQLHGSETPARCAEVRALTGRRVIKAAGVASAQDAERGLSFKGAADMILFDAKPPRDAEVPGGNGVAFDWTLLDDAVRQLEADGMAWMLSGGLNPDNVAAAIQRTGARRIDVSSGVETSPGIKSPDRVEAFVRAARAAHEERWRAAFPA